ncbi:MAG TPA: enoyl-CoA hydratase-related protein [Candidatus Eisenbacteria bacterium]|jgi:cyclohexa-1,5-dienecarbonyl-CoA hydratase
MAMIDVSSSQKVARVVLDRPPLNVIDLEAAHELAAALESLRGGDGLSAVLLSARGKAFCAGVDVRDHLPDRGAAMLHEFHRVCGLLLAIEVPVVAAVQGPALGGGCELTLMCDLVVASSRATFGQPEIKLGVFPPLAAAALPQLVPPRVANEMLFTGRILGAEEALRVGLVNRVAPEDEFPSAVDALLDELTALSPASLRLTKQAMRLRRWRPEPEEIEEAERFYVEQLMNTPDAVEGLKAFLEKRAPVWGGR